MKTSIPLAKRMAEIKPFHVMSLLGKARAMQQQGIDVIHLEVGEPDFDTPQAIIDAAIYLLQQGEIKYTPSLGLPELRQAIADYYGSTYQQNIRASQIVVTPGASGALLLLIGALIGRDDALMLAEPGYPCNQNFVRFMDGELQAIAVNESTDYQLTVQLVAEHWQENTKVVLLASPSNPTGTLIKEIELKKIIHWVADHNAYLIVDEIYQGLVYDQASSCALSGDQRLDEHIIIINSFSKYFQMTGWRLGWCIVPNALISACEHLAQNLFLAAPSIAQYAALEAFSSETLELLEQRKNVLKQRRDYLYKELINLGFKIPIKPQGAFYLYCDCSAFSQDSMKFCQDLLEKTGVAITPGIDFAGESYQQYVRFAYTQDIERLKVAVQRIGQYINEIL